MRTYNLRAEYVKRGLDQLYSLVVCTGVNFTRGDKKGSMLPDTLKVIYKYVLEEDP